LNCFALLPPVALILDLHRRADRAARDVFRKIRRFAPEIPIVVLGTLSESDTIVILELGADDYVSRPFSGRELLACGGAPIPAHRCEGRFCLS
jgi:DNA-binding response OmpR family regulator